MQVGGVQVLLCLWETLVKWLFFNKISALQLENAIKPRFLANRFQGFLLLFSNHEFSEELFFACRIGPYP